MSNATCQCGSLSDLAIVDMGDHDDVFATLVELRERGMPWWWLQLSGCTTCGQHWLIAQEERQNDIFIMRRLDAARAGRLLNENSWPDEFDRYETLLEIGRHAGKKVRFVDPEDSSLQFTIEDLAKERPGIKVSELASLLNLDPDLATRLSSTVVNRTGVAIEFDVG